MATTVRNTQFSGSDMDGNQIVEGMQACVLAVSKRGIVTYANRSAREGLTIAAGDDLLGRLEGEQELADFIERCSNSTVVLQHRLRISRESSAPVWVCRGQRLREADDGEQVLLQVERTSDSAESPSFAHAIATGAESEVELRVRELQHRFKNGIQMMMGTLDAARRRTADESARLALDLAMQQVQAIAHVQSMVTEVLAGQSVPAQQFLEELCDAVRRSLAPECVIRCMAAVTTIPAAVYTHVALIINELVTNAVKYGVSDAEHPIEVRLQRADDKMELSVTDHGPKFEAEAAGSSTGLGLELVRELVSQLGGSFTMTSNLGTQCTVKFPQLCDVASAPPEKL